MAIVRAQSAAPKPDPVVFMTGGPGAAAILDTPFLVAANVNRDRDLIIMAQRGRSVLPAHAELPGAGPLLRPPSKPGL